LEQKSCASKDCQRVKQQDIGGTLEPSSRSRVCASRRQSDTGCAEDASDYGKQGQHLKLKAPFA
jgi:hypothetical protein